MVRAILWNVLLILIIFKNTLKLRKNDILDFSILYLIPVIQVLNEINQTQSVIRHPIRISYLGKR